MKIKLFAAAAATAVLVSLSGCGSDGGQKDPAPAQNNLTDSKIRAEVESAAAAQQSSYSEKPAVSSLPDSKDSSSAADKSVTDSSSAAEVSPVTDSSSAEVSAPEVVEEPAQTVPEMVKSVVSSSGWIDSFEMFNGYMDKYGYDQNEMWFQDMTGDGEPELVVGGYGINIYQPEVHIFEIYGKNGPIAQGDALYTLWTSRKNYGHSAFTLVPVRCNDGTLLFEDGRLYEYTSLSNPNGSGAYEMYEYCFEFGQIRAEQKLYFGYSNENGSDEFYSFMSYGQETDKNGLIDTYNGLFTGRTMLKANIKTIKFSDYKQMSQEERIKKLTESYNAFSYSIEDQEPPLYSMLIKLSQSGQ